MIRTFALQAAVALVCAIVIALLLGGNDPRAGQQLAGGDALALAASDAGAAVVPASGA